MEAVRELINKGHLTAAEHTLRDRLSDAPDDAEAVNLYAVVLARKGDTLGARSHFKRAMDLRPDEPRYLVNYGMMLAQQGDQLRATEYLERATSLDPNWSRSHAQLGELALAAGHLEQAEQRFRTALRADAQDAHAMVGLAQTLLLRDQPEKALEMAQAAIERLPNEPRAQAVIGAVLLAQGHHAFARQALQNALRIDSGNARVRRLTAQAQLADGAPDAALKTLLGVRDWTEDDLSVLAPLADAALRGGHSAALIGLLDSVLPKLPRAAPIIHAAAEARLRSSRSEDALALLASYTHPESPSTLWAHRLNILARLRRIDEAYAFAKHWSEVQPHIAEAHAEYATGAELRGDADVARQAAERALGLDPRNAKALTIAVAYELKRGKVGPHYRALAQTSADEMPQPVRAMRNFLLGYGADRAGEYAGAFEHWSGLHKAQPKTRMPALSDPLGAPRELPLPLPADEHGPVVFVPHIPGTGTEQLLRALARGRSVVVMADRLTSSGRHDGLSPDQRGLLDNRLPESALRVFRRRYWRAFARERVPRGRVPIDVLPTLEWAQYAALSGALPGARVLAFVRDPRDALLHWLAFGTQPVRPVLQLELAANFLLRQYQHLDRMRSSAGLAVVVIKGEEFDADRGSLKGRIAQALGVAIDSIDLSESERATLGGLPERLENGRHALYAGGALSKAFKLLTPAAKRFGY